MQATQIMAGIYTAILMGAWTKGAPMTLLILLTVVICTYIVKEGFLSIAKVKHAPKPEKPLVSSD